MYLSAYWVFEFIKMLLGFGFVMYVWPMVVFRPHLKGKSKPYKFFFCVNMSICVINTVVLALGLIKLLYVKLFAALYFGVFIIQFYRNYHLNFNWLKDVRAVLQRTITLHHVLLNWAKTIFNRIKGAVLRWWKSTEGKRLEMILAAIVVMYGTLYFSINALQVHSYGFGDSYLHHQWVYQMFQGEIFANGVYPVAMHCTLYAISGLFGINTYSVVLFCAGAMIHVYLISAYLLMRELFHWKFSAIFALIAFLTVDQLVMNTIFGMSRLGMSVPQEFGLYTVYAVPYAVLRIMRSPADKEKLGFKPFRLSWWKKVYQNPDFILFTLTLSASISIHFYATIISAFVCMAIAGVFFLRIFQRGKFVKLVIAGMIALFLSAAPLGAGLATGHKMEGSLRWALAIIKGGKAAETAWGAGQRDFSDKEDDSEKSEEASKPKLSLSQRLAEKWNSLYKGTYKEMYPGVRGDRLLYANIGAAFLGIVVAATAIIIRFFQRLRKTKKDALFKTNLHGSYLSIAAALFFLIVAYNPETVNLPSLVAGSRVCSSLQMFAVMAYISFIDIVFTVFGYIAKKWMLKTASVLVCAGIYVFVYVTGMFHGFLYYELTRYPVAVEVTKEITENVDKNTFTIVSTTDELYQVIDYGYHEEWIDFIENSNNEKYTIPTTYLFFYIEKKPLAYAQYSFATGPWWLASEKYPQVLNASVKDAVTSQYPVIRQGRISDFLAEQKIDYGRKKADTANKLSSRQVLESKAYQWYLEFSRLHPNAGNVIYEDDEFLCYCIKQNTYCLYTLGVLHR